jgi:hypothetical protein
MLFLKSNHSNIFLGEGQITQMTQISVGHGVPNLYVLGLEACLFRDKLKQNKAYYHKLGAAWMRILLTF